MNKKINYWKIASVILFVVLILTLSIRFYNNQEVLISGIPIKKGNLNALSDLVANSKNIVVCSTDTDECFVVARTK